MRRWIDYDEARAGAYHTVTGTVKVMQGVAGEAPGAEREIVVYLPPSYAWTYRSFPVLYMQDGQNLFDEATSFAGEWRVDESLEAFAPDGPEIVVVGIANAGESRVDEYAPFVDERGRGGRADAYVRFVVQVVKPLVEAEFRVTREPEATGIAGSSMGGLVSLHAFFEYPDVFGLCAALSPSVGFAGGAFLRDLESRPFRGGRVYLDIGTREGYPRKFFPVSRRRLPRQPVLDVRRARDLLQAAGWTAGKDLLYVEEKGASHNETAWARRFPNAVRFLFGTSGA